MTAAGVDRAFWSVKEFAELVGVGKHVIYRAIDRHEIACVKVGAAKRIPDSERARLLAEAEASRGAA